MQIKVNIRPNFRRFRRPASRNAAPGVGDAILQAASSALRAQATFKAAIQPGIALELNLQYYWK